MSLDQPNVNLYFFDGTNWIEDTERLIDFTVKKSGIRRLPSCSLTLSNENFSAEADYPLNRSIKILVQASGATPTNIFQGTIVKQEREFLGTHPILKLNALSGLILIRDYITHPFGDEAWKWTPATVIGALLTAPDSGVNTGYTLVTDTGEITTAEVIENFEQVSLLDAIRRIAERVGYDGWIVEVNSEVHLYTIGSQVGGTLGE